MTQPQEESRSPVRRTGGTGPMGGRATRAGKSLFSVMIGVICLLASCNAWASVPTKRVLILFPYENNHPGFVYFDGTLRSSLQASAAFQFDFYSECMDLLRFPGEQYFEQLVELYRQKYAGRNIDLIIATLGPARDSLARYKEEVFPETPVLLVDIDTRLIDDNPFASWCAAVTGWLDFEGTLDLALGLHPAARDVYVVSGASQVDRALEALARKAFRGFADRVRFHYLGGLSMQEVLRRVSGLPAQSLIFFLNFFQDGNGKAFISNQALAMITETASVPIYSVSETFIGRGMLGGRVYSFPELGEKTAQSALRLLHGEAPVRVEPLEVRADRAVFDWPQLQRWEISESSLPRESLIRNKDFSVWDAYRLPILGILAVLILQAALISALVYNLKRRRQTNRALSASEEKLQRAADEWKTTFDSIPDLIMVPDRDLRIVRVNQAVASFYDLQPEGILGTAFDTWEDGMKKPFDRRLIEKSLQTKKLEEEEVLDEGANAWFLVSVAPILDAHGGMAGFLHTARDVTERKRAEADARRRMTELAHVARVSTTGELAASLAHEISQPLTAILSNAQAAQRFLSAVQPDVDEVRLILDDIVRDDKRVSEVIRRMRAMLKKQPGSSELFPLAEVVTECIAMVNSAAPLDGLSITAELGTDPILVRADRVQLQQVLFNLMVNAAGAMRNAPPSSRKMVISVGTEDRQTVKVSVSDSGSGIDEHNVERLFEPFYTTKPDGMGMGLSISQTIVKAHGGEMGAANNPEGGASFYFTLPMELEESSC